MEHAWQRLSENARFWLRTWGVVWIETDIERRAQNGHYSDSQVRLLCAESGLCKVEEGIPYNPEELPQTGYLEETPDAALQTIIGALSQRQISKTVP